MRERIVTDNLVSHRFFISVAAADSAAPVLVAAEYQRGSYPVPLAALRPWNIM